MTPERWEQVGEIYQAALELEMDARPRFLTQACANDAALRQEVESLLAAGPLVGEFMAAPALEAVTELMPEAPSLVGRKLNHYRVLALLGHGGMGEVYLAQDSRLNRQVALKLLPAEFASDATRVRRFEREARAASALNHPNIITIHEIGQAEGLYYLVTEFVDGQTLRQRLHDGRLNSAETLDIATQITRALEAAHTAGIVHRDIKPENVMVRRDGLVKVLDFGLAKMTDLRPASPSGFTTDAPVAFMTSTGAGVVMGTPRYMSPEQARGLDVDARSDLFSLGVLLYELLAGRPPFTGETPTDTVLAIIAQEPPPFEAAPAWQRLIRKALSKEREARYQTAADLLADLERLRQDTPAQTEVAETREEVAVKTSGVARAKLLGWVKQHPRRVALSATLLLLTALALWVYTQRQPPLTERDTVLLAEFENKTGEEVFDGTLRQALAVHLEQTPFLNLFAEDRVRETLRYMGRPPNERLTREVARELCQRQGIKSVLLGSITRLDRNYSLILEAVNSQTGATLASALAEAEGKDQVLRALGRAATQLRERLGESLASIQRFDAPLEQATTSSLEAFKAWARAVELARSGRDGAMALYKHAHALDPNFAKAAVSLSLAHNNLGQVELAAEYATQAYALRERVTERERFDITSHYHSLTTGDLLKTIGTLELWQQTYPRDFSARARLATLYRLTGQLEKALTAARAAQQLNPKAYIPYVSLGTVLVQMNRLDEARTVIEEGLAQQLGTATSHRDFYQLAEIKGDAALRQRQLDWATGRTDEYWAWQWRAQSASFRGQLRQARELYQRAATLAAPTNAERAIWFAAEADLREAVCGLCARRAVTVTPTANPEQIRTQPYVPSSVSRALTHALCGELTHAQTLTTAIAQSHPHATLAQVIWLPVLNAALALQRDNPTQTLQALQPTAAYEASAFFWPNYLRGQAYLRLQHGREAAAEFQKIVDQRGWDALSPLYPLAQLGLAQAATLNGELGKSRAHYQTFLDLWKDADAEVPMLAKAKKEFAR